MLLPFIVLFSCSWGPFTPFDGPPRAPSASFADPGLDQTGAGPVTQLWRTPARYELPTNTLPPNFDPRSTFPAPLEAKGKQRKKLRVYEGPSPFWDELEGRKAAPPGMLLEIAGEPIRYSPVVGSRTWSLRNGRIQVGWPVADGELDVSTVRIRYAGAAEGIVRRDPELSQLPTEDFVQFQVTLDDRTRPGLLLPAPGAATWALDLPAGRGATFDSVVTIAPAPLRSQSSDGAYAAVEVTHGGTTTEVGRLWVPGAGDTYLPFRVDLSAFAGKAIELTVRTLPGTNNHFDHVFFGAPTVWSGNDGAPRRVVVIGLDTTRPQNFGVYGYPKDTTPELDAIAGGAVIFDRAWTPAPRTRPSFRSATTGRRPLDAVGATNIAEVFSAHGFATAGIVANVHLQPRFGFHTGFDDWWFDGRAQAEDQVDRALAFLEAYQQRDTYLFMHIMDPHMIYGAPGSYRDRFVDDPDPTLPRSFTRSEVYGWMAKGEVSDQRKAHIEALYDGELRYTSAQLARFFDQLDRLEGRTLVVVHNDHGEEFWEHEGFEHNHSLYDDVTRGLLWFRAGAGQAEGLRVDAPVSLPDIAPTLFDFAGFDDVPPTDGTSLRGLLEGTEPSEDWADRAVGIAHLRYGLDRWGVVFRNHKYILHTGSGVEELYDLSADPGEANDLARSVDLAPWQQQLGPAHGMEAGRGWRVRIDLTSPGGVPLDLQLPQAAHWAGVVPPSMTIPNPRNRAWGEPPRRTSDQIGTVELLDDGRRLRFTPGTDPTDGLLFVQFNADVSPDDAVLLRGTTPWPLIRSTVWMANQPDGRIRIEPGMVFQPPPSEADRMRALTGAATPEEIAQLCELGYIHGESCGEEEP